MNKINRVTETLAIALKGITKDRGFSTDIGAHVFTELFEMLPVAEPACTIVWQREQLRSQRLRVGPERKELCGRIEISVPISYPNSTAFANAAKADVERRLAEYPPALPGMAPLHVLASTFNHCPEDMPLIVVNVDWRTEYKQ